MEINEAGKIVIARPVASRPAFSGFRSFTELLCTTSSPNALSKTAVAAIKPRTVRFKPAGNQNLVEMDSFEAELSGSEDSSASDDILKSKITANVIYKPIAKLVSKTTISVLANLGRDNLACLQKIPEVEAQSNNQGNSPLDLTSESCQNFTSQSEAKGTATQENSRAGKNSVLLTTDGDRPSYDGYNWRKYGQKIDRFGVNLYATEIKKKLKYHSLIPFSSIQSQQFEQANLLTLIQFYCAKV
ncbi:WRKY transcription factor 44-like [Olea europaea var. sylvestris]|uniref:WRKY transcription factor 44-like n=1 Tax=Olea europaea var. sylvestris TaxID=158386 RepID=UPI000C1D6687|nr:WRKY transcription factor 44-like [Olea europaea var. sylvestris]